MTSVRAALQRGAALLAQAGVESPALDARLLLAHARGTDQSGLLRDRDAPADWPAFHALLARRAAHEPVALIRGWQEFWSLRFAVSPATLIPRADSETLIEAALERRPPARVRRVLDLGTGTGCLLLAALSEYPNAWGLGVDRVPAAARLAAENADSLALRGRSGFLCGDWAAPLDGRFDLVLANPPYIESRAIAGLMPDVAGFEPASALDGGADGLDAYRTLAAALPRLLAPGGLAILEVGQGQAAAVAALGVRQGLAAGTRPDLAGIVRAVLLENPIGMAGGAH